MDSLPDRAKRVSGLTDVILERARTQQLRCYPARTTFHRLGEMGARRPFFSEGRMSTGYEKEKELTKEVAGTVERQIPGVEVLAVELLSPTRFCVFIDHPQGVDHALCARVTDLLRSYLNQYTVDVSSPGLERPLRKPAHFRNAVGRKVALRTSPDIGGRKRF